MNAIQRLKELETEFSKLAFPNVPHHTSPGYFSKSRETNGMTRCIIRWIELNGYFAERTGTMGRMIDNTEIVTNVLGQQKKIGSMEYIKGSGTVGSSDIKASVNGKTVYIEVKNKYTNDNRQSPDQIKYQKKIELAGGVYYIARCFDSFVDWWDLNYKRNPNYMKVWQFMIENMKRTDNKSKPTRKKTIVGYSGSFDELCDSLGIGEPDVKVNSNQQYEIEL